ncbi:MAG: LysR substrate-binding domain-containing protein, partial [Deltaproteobacteria bacterium]
LRRRPGRRSICRNSHYRRVELTAVILLLVASGRGVTVLPDWVLRGVKVHSDYITRPITAQGLTRRMYAATRSDDTTRPFMAHWMKLARSEPVKLQRG